MEKLSLGLGTGFTGVGLVEGALEGGAVGLMRKAGIGLVGEAGVGLVGGAGVGFVRGATGGARREFTSAAEGPDLNTAPFPLGFPIGFGGGVATTADGAGTTF